MQTTQDLIQRLHKARLDGIKNRSTNPLLVEVCNRIDEFPSENEELEKGRQTAKGIMSIVGGSGMAQIVEYWQLRDGVRAFQEEHEISGIEIVSSTIAGRTIEYRNWHDQLVLLDSDIPLIKADVPKVVEWFCNLVQELGYNLFRSEYIDDINEYIPATLEEVKTHIDSGFQSWIYSESIQWNGDSGHHVERFLPDSITLKINLDRPDDDTEAVYFVAENPDPGVQPFREGAVV